MESRHELNSREEQDQRPEQDLGQETEEEQQEDEYDRYKSNPELLGEKRIRAARTAPAILDLGCGDGLVLVQTLATFPCSQLPRAIGVDLDRSLLEASRERIQKEYPTSILQPSDASTNNQYDVLSRLELYYGDLTIMNEPLTSIMVPLHHSATETMDTLIHQSSHLFVYLLPEALSKLAPMLLDAIVTKHKVVLSMRWEIPELSDYLVYGGENHKFYIYHATD
ncbi:hypothetical protein FBU30_006243 [Linnemannia zychae]|nr:hypothetical protein FBU30_006243 [Linnemannia zychae]